MTNPSFLIVDDDTTFTRVLSRSLSRRGFTVSTAHSAEAALALLQQQQFSFATLDLKMQGASGLTLISRLRETNPEIRLLVLTGYASIATAVDAIKLGADHYLPKPADTDQILAALQASLPDPAQPVVAEPMSVNRLEWEHIQKVLQANEGNISATARALNMHRRTLQRKLAKYPVKR